MADKAIQELGNFDPPPFMRGKPQIWAAAIIHARGSANWMFDRSNPMYATTAEINDYFGTKVSTTSQKATLIRENLGIEAMSDEWSTQHSRQINPFAQFVELDGMIVPLNMLQEDIQTQVRQARAQGRNMSLRSK